MHSDDSTADWLSRLLSEHGRALVLYARQFCRSAEDVVQQAFVELASQRTRPANASAWLYRVVRNGAISAARAERRRASRECLAASPEAWFDRGAAQIDAREAAAALAELPQDDREIVVARIWGNLTFAEIADLVGTSLSTAQRRYEQALRTLQFRLEKPCTTNPPSPEVG